MDGVKIHLISSFGDTLDSTYTNISGYYVFNHVPAGLYFIKPQCFKTWGGGNSVDALLILNHFVELSPLTGIKEAAADVDASSYINSIDALLVLNRFVLNIDSFAAGDWIFSSESIYMDGINPITHNIEGLCYGDVNGN